MTRVLPSFALGISLLACVETRTPMMRRTAEDGPARARSDRAKLEAIIVETRAPRMDDDACISGAVSYAVDREEGIERLEQLLDWMSKQKDLETRDQVLCFPDLARRRVAWLWRHRRLDVERELRHPIAEARKAAVGLLAYAHAAKSRLRFMLDDPEFEVRVMTYYAIIDEHDEGAIPKLGEVAARSTPGSKDRNWACHALASLGKKDACPEWKERDAVDLAASGPVVDRCAELRDKLHSNDPAKQTHGMWGYVVDIDRVRQLDLRMRTSTERETCPVDEAFIDAILAKDRRDELSALAAAYRLLRTLGPLPRTPEELERGFVVNASKPKSF